MTGTVLLLAVAVLTGSLAEPVWAASAREIDAQATQALKTFYNSNPGAKALADKAKAVLIFPNVVKAGFLVGGQFGDGALRKRGKTVAYYRSLAASYGFQAGRSPLATCSSSWTKIHSAILTRVMVGNLEPDRAWSC